MKYIVASAVVLFALALIFPGWLRLSKTLWLIWRVDPYERVLPDAPTILVLGDSTAYGTGAGTSTFSIAGRLGVDFPQYTILNWSKNGRTINGLRDALPENGDYEMVLLQIGGNDILRQRDVAVVEEELREIVATLSPQTEHLVMMCCGNVGGAAAFSGERAATYEALTREYRDMFKRVAAETKLQYVDLFLEPEDDVIAQQPDRYLASDGLHPSDEGYGLWYSSLYEQVKSLLRQE